MSEGNPHNAPVFILCAARSGSTLLRLLLDAHPVLCAPPELHLLRLCRELLWVHTYTAEDGPGASASELAADARRRTRSTVDQIMSAYCERRGRQRWVEKSVATIDEPELLATLFPDARLIFLYRHALDVAQSGLAAQQVAAGGFGFEPWLEAAAGQPLSAMVDYWCDKSSRLLALERRHAHDCHRVRYEDLVTTPDEVLDGISRFLEIEPLPQHAGHAFQVWHPDGPGDQSAARATRIDSASVGRGVARGAATVSADRLARMNRLLAKLNYAPVPGPD